MNVLVQVALNIRKKIIVGWAVATCSLISLLIYNHHFKTPPTLFKIAESQIPHARFPYLRFHQILESNVTGLFLCNRNYYKQTTSFAQGVSPLVMFVSSTLKEQSFGPNLSSPVLLQYYVCPSSFQFYAVPFCLLVSILVLTASLQCSSFAFLRSPRVPEWSALA